MHCSLGVIFLGSKLPAISKENSHLHKRKCFTVSATLIHFYFGDVTVMWLYSLKLKFYYCTMLHSTCDIYFVCNNACVFLIGKHCLNPFWNYMTSYCIRLVDFYLWTADTLWSSLYKIQSTPCEHWTTVTKSFSATANERRRNWCLSK